MDRCDKWETHYNRFYVPFHGESAGTSHFRFGAPRDVGGFEYGFAGRSDTSTSADYYAASEELFSSYGNGDEQPGSNTNTYPTDFTSDLDDSNKTVGDDAETPEEESTVTEKVTYSIKLINPLNQIGFELKQWSNTTKFSDVARLRSQIKADFDTYLDGDNFQIGYIMPGHGAKGRQVPIVYVEDLTCMYSRCHRTKHVVLWVKHLRKKDLPSGGSSSRARKRPDCNNQQEVCGPAKKSKGGESSTQQAEDSGRARSNTSGAGSTRSKYSGEHNKMFELQEIVDELEKRHSKKYTIEQLRAWGNMMMMKKHESYDHPPDKPFFKQKKEGQPGTKSPGKRIHYRSQCMDQLDKWHSLLQRGVITQEQCTEMQESILSDIKKLN